MRAKPFGSFEGWSRRVREPLLWLGCADPCDTLARGRDNDPKLNGIASVIIAWREHLGAQELSAQEIIRVATIKAPLRRVCER